MERKQLVRDVKREALTRMEDAARTDSDFKAVVKQWDHLDKNRERRERLYEIGRDKEQLVMSVAARLYRRLYSILTGGNCNMAVLTATFTIAPMKYGKSLAIGKSRD